MVKSGLVITAELLWLLDGQDGETKIKTPWDPEQTMWALEDRLLTKEGLSIELQIWAIYHF